MSHPAIASKILDFCQTVFVTPLGERIDQLVEPGDLHTVASELRQRCHDFFGYLMEHLLAQATEQIVQNTPPIQRRNTALLPLSITIANGSSVQVHNYYDKRVNPDHPDQARHHLQRHWRLTGNYSPLCCDLVGFCSMTAPFFKLVRKIFFAPRQGRREDLTRNQTIDNPDPGGSPRPRWGSTVRKEDFRVRTFPNSGH